MLKIENVVLPSPEQWITTIRGARNPMNSWARIDSKQLPGMLEDEQRYIPAHFEVGPNDMDLMERLCKSGEEHRKFMRMIQVYADITAPLYWWKEFDTYKVGTVANSCSTMHKIHAKEFTFEDFSCEHVDFCPDIYFEDYDQNVASINPEEALQITIDILNKARERYLETKEKRYWWTMIQLLPSSYNQKRTVMLNYEVLYKIYRQRKGHRLDEWKSLRSWIETLPYSELITGEDE